MKEHKSIMAIFDDARDKNYKVQELFVKASLHDCVSNMSMCWEGETSHGFYNTIFTR